SSLEDLFRQIRRKPNFLNCREWTWCSCYSSGRAVLAPCTSCGAGRTQTKMLASMSSPMSTTTQRQWFAHKENEVRPFTWCSAALCHETKQAGAKLTGSTSLTNFSHRCQRNFDIMEPKMGD